MPALPSSILEPLWVQFHALLPTHPDTHPLGCHRRRIPDRIVFDKLIQILVFGCGYRRIADATCSATTLRRRRDQWAAVDFPPEGLCWRIHTGDSSARSRVRREAQVPPGGMPLSQASTRTRLRASAVSTCCRWVLARPR